MILCWYHSTLAFPSAFYHHLPRRIQTSCESNPPAESTTRVILTEASLVFFDKTITREIWPLYEYPPSHPFHRGIWSRPCQTLTSRPQTRWINHREHSSSFKVSSLSISTRLWLTDSGRIRENGTSEHEQRIIVLDPVPSSDPNQPLVSDMMNLGVEMLGLSRRRTGALHAKPWTSPLSWPPRHLFSLRGSKKVRWAGVQQLNIPFKYFNPIHLLAADGRRARGQPHAAEPNDVNKLRRSRHGLYLLHSIC